MQVLCQEGIHLPRALAFINHYFVFNGGHTDQKCLHKVHFCVFFGVRSSGVKSLESNQSRCVAAK